MKTLRDYRVAGALYINDTGLEAQVSDQVTLFLDQEANPAFPVSITGTIQHPIVKVDCGSETSYVIEYDEADLDGAAALLRPGDIVDATVVSGVTVVAQELDTEVARLDATKQPLDADLTSYANAADAAARRALIGALGDPDTSTGFDAVEAAGKVARFTPYGYLLTKQLHVCRGDEADVENLDALYRARVTSGSNAGSRPSFDLGIGLAGFVRITARNVTSSGYFDLPTTPGNLALDPIVTEPVGLVGGETLSNIGQGDEVIVVASTGTLSSLTLSLLEGSPNIRKGQIVTLCTTVAITSLTITSSTTMAVFYGTLPTSATANSVFQFQCINADGEGTWIRIK